MKTTKKLFLILLSFLLILPQVTGSLWASAGEAGALPSDATASAAEARSLPVDKTYYLRNANTWNMYLDLQASGTTNSTHFQQYPGYYASELFRLKYQAGGYYTLETTLVGASGRMVMDGRSNCVAGAQVILYQETSNSPEQRWHLRRNSNGTFSIAPKKNVYLNLAVDPPSTESHAKVKLANRNDSDPSQQWCLEPAYVRDYDWSYVLYDANQFSYISSGYRLPGRPNHYGIDIIGKSQSINEQYIYAPADGVIKYTYDWHPSAGNYVVIEFDDFWTGTGRKLRAGYMHMKDPCFFEEGTRIDKGYHIGFVGNTGNSTGPHLHFSVFYGEDGVNWADSSNCINPQRFFPDVPFTGETSTQA